MKIEKKNIISFSFIFLLGVLILCGGKTKKVQDAKDLKAKLFLPQAIPTCDERFVSGSTDNDVHHKEKIKTGIDKVVVFGISNIQKTKCVFLSLNKNVNIPKFIKFKIPQRDRGDP